MQRSCLARPSVICTSPRSQPPPLRLSGLVVTVSTPSKPSPGSLLEPGSPGSGVYLILSCEDPDPVTKVSSSLAPPTPWSSVSHFVSVCVMGRTGVLTMGVLPWPDPVCSLTGCWLVRHSHWPVLLPTWPLDVITFPLHIRRWLISCSFNLIVISPSYTPSIPSLLAPLEKRKPPPPNGKSSSCEQELQDRKVSIVIPKM